MKQITERQKEILNFISDYQAENSYPPTVREIGDHFGVSIRAVQDHITALQKKGFITQTQKKSRSIKVLVDERQKDQGMFMEKVPLIGTIAAGKPLLCEENYEGYVTLTEPFIRPGKNYFALHVRGQSMINAGILEGDLAIIEQTSTATDGQIVVAVIDDAITLKRYFKEPSRIRLQPENPAFHPIYCQDVRIVGILTNLVRTY
ncbi:MAG: transcriptional repressor LexA [Treponema sp.]|uniref:transcriptional repressor LexA n=1 Tax=Treponema sp. TaxID=166 RepID=UPI001D289128|nr:transcriptional repressor LexA [Treponema sp.]MCI5697318.1 transcriptional repressor LexA [Spirochaetia bacterium]MBS7310662.1 transcriptional repressor LexA [Treponema sp.]MCQ2600457.1 transcriptional repressor LexA [Treponema sp.]MDD5810864.1 transcriptional repressor LexA [Treponema sp.]MDY5886068.1 transcriptional repressor LexA [Treponema sp.]